MKTESSIDDILRDIPRFRILCVGCSGVGKSSLINRVFGITETKVSEYVPGEATIDDEFVSDENKYFVLHDSKGFEPGNDANFGLAVQFLHERHKKELLRDKLHAIWLCTEMPRAGGRVLEEGDKKFLKLAHQLQTPVVVVFTKYDLLVRSKEMEAEEDTEEGTDEKILHEMGKVNANKAFEASVASLKKSTTTLRIPTPPYIPVSINDEKSIAALVDMTRKIVEERLKGDAWVTWAIAQRASLPTKIEACVDKGISYYYRALAGCTPGVGNTLLWQCLAQVHRDIVTCWNFRDEDKILIGAEFQQLILHLVQEVHGKTPSSTSASSLGTINNFVNLIKVSTIPIAVPVSILGSTYFFLEWVAKTALERIPEVERLLMAYTVDLISVLRALFDCTLKPDLAGKTNWEVLRVAFEDYEHSNTRNKVHASCRAIYGKKNPTLTRERFRETIIQLLGE